jgi:hypothetical protein
LAATPGILFAGVHAAVRDLPLPAYAQSRAVVIVAKPAPALTRLTTAAAVARHG